MCSGAICGISHGLPERASNPDVAWKLVIGRCPECLERELFIYTPSWTFSGHDMCQHFHCSSCDNEWCWLSDWGGPEPVWLPPLPTGMAVYRIKRRVSTASLRRVLEWSSRFLNWWDGGRDPETGRFLSKPRKPRWVFLDPAEQSR